jgi:dephospho-CoA kinase
MLVIGLTGSIGMGKSNAAEVFRQAGVAVCDADQEVHKLYSGAASKSIETAFPGTTVNGKVDRAKLATSVMAHPTGFKILEEIVHPWVHAAERTFLQREAAKGSKMAVIESPLLFEVDTANKVDVIVVVSASPDVQRQRVLARHGMTDTKLNVILSRQLLDSEKRRRADYVVDTNGPLEDTSARILALIKELATQKPRAFNEHWA